MRNVVYFLGSHGSGKSTLIKKLAEKEPGLFEVDKKLKTPKLEDPFERQKIKIIEYYWDALKQKKFSKENPSKVLLCDRCIARSYVYIESLFQCGWLTKKQRDGCFNLCEELFDESIKPKNIIFLNPSLEELKRNIKKRWSETSRKKWREDDFEYLGLVKKNFESLYSDHKSNVLEVDFLDLEKRVHTCYDWVKKTVGGDHS